MKYKYYFQLNYSLTSNLIIVSFNWNLIVLLAIGTDLLRRVGCHIKQKELHTQTWNELISLMVIQYCTKSAYFIWSAHNCIKFYYLFALAGVFKRKKNDSRNQKCRNRIGEV